MLAFALAKNPAGAVAGSIAVGLASGVKLEGEQLVLERIINDNVDEALKTMKAESEEELAEVEAWGYANFTPCSAARFDS